MVGTKKAMTNKMHKGQASPVEKAFLEMRVILQRRLTRILVNPQDVEDILQDTYVNSITSEEKAKIRNPKAYLMQVARNLALKELSKKSRQLTDSIEVAGGFSLISNEPTAEDQISGEEKMVVLAEAVSMLPPKCREAFLLCKVYGLSYKEISRRMEISVSTVEKHMITSLKRCSAHMLKAQDGDSAQKDITNVYSHHFKG